MLLRSVQIASVVLEGSHLDPTAQPLDLQILEVVFLVVLDDDLLQFTNLTLHPGTQLSLHLQQSLQTTGTVNGLVFKWFREKNIIWTILPHIYCIDIHSDFRCMLYVV